jgi:hypothetical protein
MSRWTCFSSSSTFVFLAEHGGFSLPGTARIELGVDPETATLLRRHRRAQLEEHLMVGDGYRDGDLLFAKPDGVHYHPEAVSKVFDRRVARWGLTRITFHDTHHTWATPRPCKQVSTPGRVGTAGPRFRRLHPRRIQPRHTGPRRRRRGSSGRPGASRNGRSTRLVTIL